MRTLIILIALFTLLSNQKAQTINERKIESEVTAVTVFIEGAQIIRIKNIEINKGISTLIFSQLSPFIDAKSIKVKVQGALTILSVNHLQNYNDTLEKEKQNKEIKLRLAELDQMIQTEKTYLSIIDEDLEFLKTNRKIG